MKIGQLASLACVLEATIPKPGNVHRSADFADATLSDFLASAIAIGEPLNQLEGVSLGQVVLECIVETRKVTRTNTNLGLVLLLVPLALAANQDPGVQQEAVGQVLSKLRPTDARDVYQAIRISQAGGLGQVERADIKEDAPEDLLTAMELAADRDLIARQYVTRFSTVFEFCLPLLLECLGGGQTLTSAVIHTHVATMAEFPDTLIARKCGGQVADESAFRAHQALQHSKPGESIDFQRVAELDFWLRSDGNRRNPGTTADMMGATLFVGLVNGVVEPPFR